jgi:RNA polymerase sigma-70 factor, ECF subfamily
LNPNGRFFDFITELKKRGGLESYKDSIYCELIVLRCARGERKAFEELIAGWEKRLFFFLRQLTGHEQEAWDILQETWLKVVRGIGSLRQPRSLNSWLYSVARNTAFDRLRSKPAECDLEECNESDLEDGKDPESLRFEDADQVHFGLGRLSLPHREVLTLFFLEDFPVGEIAGILHLPEGTVKSRLHHAKCALRDILNREGRIHG